MTVWNTVSGSGTMHANSNGSTVVVRGSYWQMILYLVLNMWTSHAGLPILMLIILLAKRCRRHATLLNLCIAFIIVGFSSSLLFYGSATTGPEPPPNLCLFQASLLHGMPLFTPTAAFMLVLQMFLRIHAAHYAERYQDDKHIPQLWIMLISPYVLFCVPVLATAVIGAHEPHRVTRNRRYFYCSLDCLLLSNTVSIISAVILLGTTILIAWTTYILAQHRLFSRSKDSPLRATIGLTLPIRIIVFGLYLLCAISLSLVSIFPPPSPAPDLMIAFAPTVVIIIFGTQKAGFIFCLHVPCVLMSLQDVINVLCFWRRGYPGVIRVKSEVGVIPDLSSAFGEPCSLRKI